jgi:hypothetical protein
MKLLVMFLVGAQLQQAVGLCASAVARFTFQQHRTHHIHFDASHVWMLFLCFISAGCSQQCYQGFL